MKSLAFHSARHAADRKNPLAVCPHLANTQRLTRVDPASPHTALGDLFSSYVLDGSHPCVMARSMVNRQQVFLASYGELGDPDRCADVCHDLYEVLTTSEADSSLYSLVTVFPSKASHTEKTFERALWDQLNGMHQFDRHRFAWDSCVSQDPENPGFSFSVGGTAWYVVGLHPGASRSSRQFAVPALIFNRHAQFTELREQGRFEQIRDRIRERDVQLQGSVNPMLKDHGDASEAIQYSGRAVDSQWSCPFAQRQLS